MCHYSLSLQSERERVARLRQRADGVRRSRVLQRPAREDGAGACAGAAAPPAAAPRQHRPFQLVSGAPQIFKFC